MIKPECTLMGEHEFTACPSPGGRRNQTAYSEYGPSPTSPSRLTLGLATSSRNPPYWATSYSGR